MLVFYSDFARSYSVRSLLSNALVLLLSTGFFATATVGQQPSVPAQELTEDDGQPVLLKHLPDYEKVREQAVFVTDKQALKNSVANEGLLDLLEFPPGTEAVTATYPEGRLVIVEYTNPQISTEMDAKVLQFITSNPQPQSVYRRIGNYNAFVLGSVDPAPANDLLDQVKYQKTVQWLGEDPYILRRLERYMMSTSRDIAISTVLVIVFGLGSAVLIGIASGFVFFRFRDQKRSARAAFSDAGGLTRLNLDGLSE